MTEKKTTCDCEGAVTNQAPNTTEEGEMTLANLPVGTTATIVKIMPKLRERKKFADIGLVAGTELLMEAHAPFGGLLRVKIMETSMALHRDDAANILIKPGKNTKTKK